jgi:hypothetical protein
MDSTEFQEIVLRRKLQAILIGCSIVLLIVLLVFILTTLIWLPCMDGCPPRYDDFVASMGYATGYSETQSYFDSIFFSMIVVIVLGGGTIFRALTLVLRRDLRRWLVRTDAQQYLAAAAAKQLEQAQAAQAQLAQPLILTSDGELAQEMLTQVYPQLSEAERDRRSKSLLDSDPAQQLINAGIRWFLRDVWYALNITVVVGCGLFVIGWHIGFPTDSWAAVGVEMLAIVGWIPGCLSAIILGFYTSYMLIEWGNRVQNRDALLNDIHTLIQKRLKAADFTFSHDGIEPLLAEEPEVDTESEARAKRKPARNDAEVDSGLSAAGRAARNRG